MTGTSGRRKYCGAVLRPQEEPFVSTHWPASAIPARRSRSSSIASSRHRTAS